MAEGASRYRIAVLALLAVVATSALVLAGQGVLADLSRSLEDSEAPVLYAEVDSEGVSDTVSGSLEVRSAFERELRLPGAGIFTREGLPAGAEVQLGVPVATFDERPLFALAGAIPAYRGLAVGTTGADVAQLQASLVALGYSVGDRSGTYAESTARAVYALYVDRGYSPVDAGGAPTTRPRAAALPNGEFDFLPSLPAVTTGSCGRVGDLVPKEGCTIVGGSATLTITIARVDALRVRQDMPVDVVVDGVGQLDGTLGQAFATDESHDGDEATSTPQTMTFAVSVDPATELPPDAGGRGRIVVAESEPGALAIAAVAIRADLSGATWLEADSGDRVDVELGLCAEGRCVVAAKDLAPGDRFVIPAI